MPRQNIHIIVAAGSGSRFGAEMPKQFCPLAGRPMLMTSLERLDSSAPGARLIVVLNESMIEPGRQMCEEHYFTLPHELVTVGA
ncbi:MAG: 2-C-methyl-D-erythritol 4-phosphate cytidylyltransferase, partial [Duncaniella sp.]|nr:2-C-methyl-D-erythritol 4-phosphate cytidylyltransferase [Duncaniella sp.]